MRNVIRFLAMGVMALFLVSCATTGERYFDEDETETAGIESTDMDEGEPVQTYSIDNEDNLLGSNEGPQEGNLAVRSFYFKFDSNVVNPKDYAAIRQHARYLLSHPWARIVIEGNADIRGSREYNIGLGQRRADAVANILKIEGVAKKQVRTLSYGAEKPIALGHTEEAYRLNRRSDIVYESN